MTPEARYPTMEDLSAIGQIATAVMGKHRTHHKDNILTRFTYHDTTEVFVLSSWCTECGVLIAVTPAEQQVYEAIDQVAISTMTVRIGV